jgi:hypothetical protein
MDQSGCRDHEKQETDEAENGRHGEREDHHHRPDDSPEHGQADPKPGRAIDVHHRVREIWILFIELALDLGQDPLLTVV